MRAVKDEFSRLELNLGYCRDNFKHFKSLLRPETKVLVLVKANAYGHGGVDFARMMQISGADYLAVALPVEGVELRKGGIYKPIIVLTAGTDYFPEIVDNALQPGIPNMYALKLLIKALQDLDITHYPIHITLDTGMHRLGFRTEELDELISFVKDCPWVRIRSIYSHLAAADEPEHDDFTLEQLRIFKENADRISEGIGYKPMYHILNTAGIERFTEYQYDMVRLGIGIYGIGVTKEMKGLKPVASLKCKILQVKTLGPEDGTVGYGRHGKIAREGTVIATIPVGYADGINRHLGCGRASFSIDGKRVPTIGNICMDMCMLDVTGTGAKAGDTVTIFGEDPTVEELAGILDTIPYEILTSVPRRIERVIVNKV